MSIINKVIEELTNIREKINEIERKNDALQLSNDILNDDVYNLERENESLKKGLRFEGNDQQIKLLNDEFKMLVIEHGTDKMPRIAH